MVVREYHGVMHMLRTTLFSQIFLNIFNPGSDLKMRFLTALSAAFHDSAREDEGVDRWDEMSAWNLRHFLMLFNSPIRDDSGLLSENIIISQVEIAMCYKALSKKDPPKSEGFKSDLQKSVHDADCIEIIRCLSDPSEFKASELQAASVLPKEKLDLFIQEAILFIKNTESLEVKTHYEHFSRDPYGELLDYLQTNAALYPKMNFYFSLKN
jgi:hypothetical protein